MNDNLIGSKGSRAKKKLVYIEHQPHQRQPDREQSKHSRQRKDYNLQSDNVR